MCASILYFPLSHSFRPFYKPNPIRSYSPAARSLFAWANITFSPFVGIVCMRLVKLNVCVCIPLCMCHFRVLLLCSFFSFPGPVSVAVLFLLLSCCSDNSFSFFLLACVCVRSICFGYWSSCRKLFGENDKYSVYV